MKHPRIRPYLLVKRTYVDLARERQLSEARARKVVLSALLLTTTIVISALFILLLLSFTLAHNEYIAMRVLSGGLAVSYMIVVNVLFAKHYYRLTSSLLVALYMFIAVVSVWEWGVNVPFALLMMSIAIVLGGILLGAVYSLLAAAALSMTILVVEALNTMGLYNPNTSWQVGAQPKLGEALGYCLLIIMLALISWLFGRQIEQSLNQARRAELALLKEKRLLASRLEARTEELKAAQLQEMQQLYRFAELGQLSTALIHDIANHLAVLTLDIEHLKNRPNSKLIKGAIDNAHQSISYIDTLVNDVRARLRSEENPRRFHVAKNAQNVAENLRSRFDQAGVRLEIQTRGLKQSMWCYGDAVRFSQAVTILLLNALDATKVIEHQHRKHPVTVNITANKADVSITVSDWGLGIPPNRRSKIFTPFNSTKKKGLGIGLFIAKTIIETHFNGTIELAVAARPTTFKINLPTKGVTGVSK